MQLFEKYRPKTWAQVIGQDKAVQRIDALRPRGLAGRAYWVSGATGVGKTTIARLIASEVASEFSTVEIDAGDLTVASLREITRAMHTYGMGDNPADRRSGRAVIVNEAHGLRADVIRALLVDLEQIPGHVVWVFTTTKLGQASLFEAQIDASPLLSRCTQIALTNQGLVRAFAPRLREIAQAEGVDGAPIEAYEKLIKSCGNNLREAIQEVDGGALCVAAK